MYSLCDWKRQWKIISLTVCAAQGSVATIFPLQMSLFQPETCSLCSKWSDPQNWQRIHSCSASWSTEGKKTTSTTRDGWGFALQKLFSAVWVRICPYIPYEYTNELHIGIQKEIKHNFFKFFVFMSCSWMSYGIWPCSQLMGFCAFTRAATSSPE